MKQWQNEIFSLYIEAKQFEAGKYHPRFGKTAQEFRTRGFSVPSRDAMIFISNLLERVGIFSEEEADSVIKNFKAAERRLRFLELLEVHAEHIKAASAEIEDAYGEQLEKYSKVESVNRGAKGRTDKYEANAAARELVLRQKQELKDLKSQATGGASDALNVLSAGLDEADQEMVSSLKASFEDQSTIFEIKLASEQDAQRVANYLKPFAGDSEIEVYGNSVEFSADPNSEISQLVAKIGPDRVEDTINDWIENNTDGGAVVIITPDSDEDIESLMAKPERKKFEDEGPESTNEDEPEYGSALPDAPEISDERSDEDFPKFSSSKSYDDDEDWGGDSDYTPGWARYEDEEHFGSRRAPHEVSHDSHGEGDPRDLGPEFYDDEPVCDECKGTGGKEYPLQGEMKWKICRHCGGTGKSKFSKYPDEEECTMRESTSHKMSPQQVNLWMASQRNKRFQNMFTMDEKWGK